MLVRWTFCGFERRVKNLKTLNRLRLRKPLTKQILFNFTPFGILASNEPSFFFWQYCSNSLLFFLFEYFEYYDFFFLQIIVLFWPTKHSILSIFIQFDWVARDDARWISICEQFFFFVVVAFFYLLTQSLSISQTEFFFALCAIILPSEFDCGLLLL